MRNNKLSVKAIVAIGIGAAVFLILGRFASIPTGIPNTTLETSYAFLALMAVIYGPVAGFSIGFIGHTLKDLTWGAPWFSWIIASAVVGLVIGLSRRIIDVNSGIINKKKIIIFNIYQIVANAIAWIIVAPGLDVLIYAEPANKVFLQGTVSFISNSIVVAVLGTILVVSYGKTRIQTGSLRKEY